MSPHPLHGSVAVLSPHLDDAALSLGASIAAATRAGAEVSIVTVLANDPDHPGPAGAWDAACGFATAVEAARARREEDREACEILGAQPVWLLFGDREYGLGAEPAVVRSAIGDAVAAADTVVLPGFPLDQPDHAFLTRLALTATLSGKRVGLYVEQPYAALRLIGRGRRTWVSGLTMFKGMQNLARIGLRTRGGRELVRATLPAQLSELAQLNGPWSPLPATRSDRGRKRRAVSAYRSQISGFGPLVLERISAYERAAGGEAVAWIEPTIAESVEA